MSVQKPPFFHLFMATGFGSGFSPVAPGTAGSFAGGAFVDGRLFPIAIWNLADCIGSGHCLFYRAGNIFECGYGKILG